MRDWGQALFTEVFDVGSTAWTTVSVGLSDLSVSMGRFDGTWLEGLDASDEDKAAFTTLLAGVSQLDASKAMNADIKRLLEAPFDGTGLVSRDALLRSVLSIAQEQHAYVSERVTVSAGVVSLDFPPGAPLALDAMRDLVRNSLSVADQAGLSLTGPGRVVVAPQGGTLAAVDGKDNLLIGGDQVDGLIGGDGADDLIAGEGDDTLLGGGNTDDLFGGNGADVLDGGEGSDYLRGGAGADTYRFSGSWGSDTIIDSDGQGQIEIDGVRLEGGKKVADGVWINHEQGVVYSLVGSGADAVLVIQRDSSLNSIRVRGWENGGLGLAMDDEPAQQPDAARTFNGDQRAPLRGIEINLDIKPGDPRYNTYSWAATTWAGDGTLSGGVAEAGFNDVITGGSTADVIHGLGGNDALDGAGGSDQIDGGTGDDLIGGGAGSDVIHGGAGNDYIYGATGLEVPQRVGPDDRWNPPGGQVVITRGSTWGVYESNDSNTVVGGGSLTMDGAADVVFAEDGDDRVTGGLGDDYIDGGNGADQLWGHGGSDTLVGGAGADNLNGDGFKEAGLYQTLAETEHGNDLLDGGDGDDQLIGGGANDALFGGAGADLLYGDDESKELAGDYHGDDYLDGGDGNDVLLGGGADDVLIGGAGNDLVWGDESDEKSLQGTFHGSDRLEGGSGDDQLIGGGADDVLFGGADADILLGDDNQANLAGSFHGADFLDGGDGNDQLYGGGDEDTLVGGTGDDVLVGDDVSDGLAGEFHGNDELDGGDGNDQLYGAGADDALAGGAGNDLLRGDLDTAELAAGFHGNDFLDGGDGDDTLLGDGGDDTLVGGDGDDFLSGDDQLSATAETTMAGNDVLFGGAGNDILLAGGGRNELSGDEGNDNLWGGDGDDILRGGSGNDNLLAGKGNDVLDGGAGSDSYYVSSGSGDKHIQDVHDGYWNRLVLDGGFTRETIRIGIDGAVSISTAAHDTVIHLDGADLGNLAGTAPIDFVDFANGSSLTLSELIASSAVDIAGTQRADTLNGTAYDDTLDGRGGNDTLIGGDGNDSYRVDTVYDRVVEQAGGGIDTVIARLNHNLAANVENLRLEGNGPLNGTGNALDNTLFASAGDNVLDGLGGIDTASYADAGAGVSINLVNTAVQATGGSGRDRLLNIENVTGSRFNDSLIGNALANTLEGGAGNDTLRGWVGNDQLIGGTGNDTYQFSRGDGKDSITEIDGTAGNHDVLQFGPGIGAEQLWFQHVGNNLDISVIGTQDRVSIKDWYLGDQHHVEEIRTSNGRMTLDSQVQALVQAMATFSVPPAGQTTLSGAQQSGLEMVIAASWH